MTSATTSGSQVPANWCVVRDLAEERLVFRFAAPEGIEPEPSPVEIDFGPDEPVEPVPIDRQAMAEDGGQPGIGRPAEEDEPTDRRSLEINLIVRRERAPVRRGLDPDCRPPAARRDVRLGASLEVVERAVGEAVPQLRLPAAVEALDRSLEAGLSRWREDRLDAEGEAGSNDGADRVRPGRRADEPAVVVELGVTRQSDLMPVPDESVDRLADRDRPLWPGGDEPAVEADPGENGDVRAVSQPEALDRVEAVELDPPLAEVGQVPAGWRSWAPPPTPVEDVMPLEDPADRPERRDRARQIGLLKERRSDCRGAVLTEDARLAQLPAEAKDDLFDGRVGPGRPMGVSGRSLQSTRSRRLSAARASQRWTVARPTPYVRATDRWDPPRRTAATIARRRCSRHGVLAVFRHRSPHQLFWLEA